MKTKRGRSLKRVPLAPWTAFESAPIVLTPEQAAFRAQMPEEARKTVFDGKDFLNSRYHVNVREQFMPEMGISMTHLSIKHIDRRVMRDWRELQRIKNELCGPKREAVELFPSEERLVDTSNQYHLWVLPEGQMFPFGFFYRAVSEGSFQGSAQRPFEVAPEDTMTADELAKRMLQEMQNGEETP